MLQIYFKIGEKYLYNYPKQERRSRCAWLQLLIPRNPWLLPFRAHIFFVVNRNLRSNMSAPSNVPHKHCGRSGIILCKYHDLSSSPHFQSYHSRFGAIPSPRILHHEDEHCNVYCSKCRYSALFVFIINFLFLT